MRFLDSGSGSRFSARRLLATLGFFCLLFGAMTQPAHAQTCTALTPVTNGTFDGIAGQVPTSWSVTHNIGTNGTVWTKFLSTADHNSDMSTSSPSGQPGNVAVYNSIQQNVVGVGGSSIIEFTASWRNGGGGTGGGNRVDFQVLYGGTVYATMLTSAHSTTPANTLVAPAPTAQNSAVLTTVSGNWTTVNTATVFRLTLPAGIPTGGELQFRTSREENTEATGATDDLQLSNVSILSPQLCLRKQTTNQTGNQVFTFSRPANVDAALATPTYDGTISITTTAANTPVPFDAAATAGVQPMVVNRTVAGTITETPPAGYTVSDISCTGAGAVTTNLGTGALTIPANGIAAGTMAVCTYTNQANADLSITKTNTPGLNGEVDQANDTVTSGAPTTYELRVTNNGPNSITNSVVRDTPGAGITCPSGNTVTITGNGVPVGTFTIANLTGAGITLGTLTTGQTAALTFTCNVQ